MARLTPNLLGRRFVRLTVKERAKNSPNGDARWVVVCDCGTEKVVSAGSLRHGSALSCGCLRRENAARARAALREQQRLAAEARLASGALTCTRCGKEKPLEKFPAVRTGFAQRKPYCLRCWADYQTLSKYGISVSEKEQMIARQGGICAVPGCGREVTARSPLDHCHASGQVRSVLCNGCNTSLGMLGEDPRRIEGLARYARQWKQLRLVPGGKSA